MKLVSSFLSYYASLQAAPRITETSSISVPALSVYNSFTTGRKEMIPMYLAAAIEFAAGIGTRGQVG